MAKSEMNRGRRGMSRGLGAAVFSNSAPPPMHPNRYEAADYDEEGELIVPAYIKAQLGLRETPVRIDGRWQIKRTA